jgi:hypothetical protein
MYRVAKYDRELKESQAQKIIERRGLRALALQME